MTLGLVFWIIMLLWFVFSISNAPPNTGWQVYGGTALLFILFAVLGWAVFGAPIQGK